MSSSEEVEDDGHWIAGEWHSAKRRRRGHQSKEEALYGIFGNFGDDSFSFKKQPRRSVTGGIGFTSGGSLNPNSDDDEEQEQSADRSEEHDRKRPHSPLPEGFGRENDDLSPDEVDEKDLRSSLPTSFSSRPTRRKKSRWGAGDSDDGKAGLGSANFHKDFGNFEKHTKGIGLKLLRKMGFKGRLGKNETGRVNPVLAKQRPRGAGLNFEGADTRDEDLAFRNDAEKEKKKRKVETQEKHRRQEAEGWKRSAKKQQKPKKVFVTAAELVSRKSQPQKRTELIVDYTQGGKVVNIKDALDSSAISSGTAYLPELQFNIGKLVQDAERQIFSLDGKLVRARRVFTNARAQCQARDGQLMRERARAERLRELSGRMDALAVRFGHSLDMKRLQGEKPSKSVEMNGKEKETNQIPVDD
eukprot:969988_1